MNNPNLDWFYDQLKNHTLEPLEIGQHVKTYYLRQKPSSRLMSTLLIFTPEGIIITGDLYPGRRERSSGLVSRGYGLGWFSDRLDPRYLASKFLTEVWVPEKFVQSVKEYIGNAFQNRLLDTQRRRWRVGYKIGENWTEVKALREFMSQDELYQTPFEALGNLPHYQTHTGRWHCPYDSDFLGGGYDYDPAELGWLVAIQRRFSELIGGAVIQ